MVDDKKKIVDKKKRKKLKRVLKKGNVKQTVKQSTNINIKIGDTGKKKRKKRKKKQVGGEPMRIQRRPHLPTNPLIGAINYTPPPGYFAPGDLARALPPPPPPYVPPPLPVAAAPIEGPAGELGAGVGAEGAPLVPFHPAGIAPLAPPRRRAEIDVPRYNVFEPPPPHPLSYGGSSSSATLYPQSTSYGGSTTLSPATAQRRGPARADPTYNPMISESAIAQQNDDQFQRRLRASGFSPGLYDGPGEVVPSSGAGGGGAGRVSEGSGSEQEDEGKSGLIESVNPVVYRQGQALDGVRTGLAPINSGGASGGLIGGGSTLMGNGGTPLEEQVNYPGQKIYKKNADNVRKGRAGQPKLKPGEGGAGGARKGSGRKKKEEVRQLDTVSETGSVRSTTSSMRSRMRSSIARSLGIGKSPRPGPVGEATTKGTTTKRLRLKTTPAASGL
jgi:hypothetical protein